MNFSDRFELHQITPVGSRRVTATIQHPNVCPTYAVEDAVGLSLVAMEYLSGPLLSEYAAHKKLSLAAVLALGAPIARGASSGEYLKTPAALDNHELRTLLEELLTGLF